MYERFGIKYILSDSERLEKVELEAARILIGLTSYASLLSIYTETGWENLQLGVKKENFHYSVTYSVINHLIIFKIYYLLLWVKPITTIYETLETS